MSSPNFQQFAAKVRERFVSFGAQPLFRTTISGDELWAAYLAAFPEGTNSIFRVRTEHDGSYDRSFIRKLGNVVALTPNGPRTIWGDLYLPEPYATVAARLNALVEAAPIEDAFFINENHVSIERNVESRDGVLTEFHHFNAPINPAHFTKQVGEKTGAANTRMQTYKRAMTELSLEAGYTVLDLIDQNALYRGAEFRNAVVSFITAKIKWRDLSNYERAFTAWTESNNPVAGFRNTAIGSLVVDLSDGKDVEQAVKSFEAKVAPTNYKRPTAIITQAMIDKAVEKIDELGLRESLERRFAVIGDVNVRDVLWVDNSVQAHMKDGLRDLLGTAVKPTEPKGKQADIGVEAFLADIVPTAASIELFFDSKLRNNLVSLTAPVHAGAPSMFKWDNAFGWSYNGNITDSIAEKVKAAGGNINAKLRVSLAWNNYDDLDLHAECPDGHIGYFEKKGILDVDMNAGGRRQSRTPVENMAWQQPRNGTYEIYVHNYCRVETQDQGFTLEVANNGAITHYSFDNNSVQNMPCLQFDVKNGVIKAMQVLNKNIKGTGIAIDVWGIQTQRFVKVNTMLLSPNHWGDNRTGNKHYIFVLDGCVNDEATRGIYNEFLKPELDVHRKVFEVLGNKTKCQPSVNQLSGLGFSSTQTNSVLAKVANGDGTRLYNIVF
jgi:hypothetical protein